MRSFSKPLVSLLLAASAIASLPDVGISGTGGVDAFIASESKIAYQGILNNIGSAGIKSVGALNGVIVAAPSDDPDYKFTWVRDSSLVYKLLIDTYVAGKDSSLLKGIYAWIESQGRLQQLDTPSGYARAGALGEPKFELNETAFTGSWGRPQRDGPALRSVSIIEFANYLLDHQNKQYVTQTIWPIVELDLNYIRDFWNQTGFDLWEETSGSSHFTSAAQHRALRAGSAFAQRLGYKSLSQQYAEQADNVLCLLQAYWSSSGSYIVSNINLISSRTGLDANSILSSVHNFDSEAGCDATTFQPCSDKALANHFAVVNSFRSIYAINANATSGAVAIGRYAEDVYQGGNPWYLAVFAASEQLYYALAQWKSGKTIPVTTTSLPFFKQFLPSARAGSYSIGSKEYTTISTAVKAFADGFISVNQKYIGKSGALAEQFSRFNGTPVSAPDLTWSYASAITAFNARAGNLPQSWGAKGLKSPKVCVPRPVSKLPVTFNLQSASENAFIVGSLIELGVWNADLAVPLNATTPGTAFTVTINIPRDSGFEYKYIRKANGTVVWQSDPNNNAITPSNGTLTLQDIWR